MVARDSPDVVNADPPVDDGDPILFAMAISWEEKWYPAILRVICL